MNNNAPFDRPAKPATKTTRRNFLNPTGAVVGGLWASELSGGAAVLVGRGKKTDIRIERIRFGFEEYSYRAPGKFAGTIMDRATLLTVECVVKTAGGRVATGTGCMPFNHILSYPAKAMSHEAKNGAMKTLAERIAKLTGACQESGWIQTNQIRGAAHVPRLQARPEIRMHDAGKLCPVVIDESLIDVESLLAARDLGWTGAVVKSPKGLSNMLLVVSAAGKEKILLCGGRQELSGRRVDSNRRSAGAHADHHVGRSERTAVLPAGKQSVGIKISGNVSDH